MLILNKWILSIGSLLIFILLSFVIIFILNKVLKLTTKRLSLDSRIAKALKNPLRLSIVLVGILVANYYLKPDLRVDGFNLVLAYKIVAIFIVTYTLINIVKAVLTWYIDNLKFKKHANVDYTIFQFISKIITIILCTIAVLITLSLLGVEIKPVLAGLGIAGLAVALALQDTLSNFFSAIYIAADQPVKIGDYIEVSGTNEKGYITEIGWRSTRLTTREKNIIIIPNSKLAQSIIINFNQVQARFRVEIPIGISYKSNLEKVENITVNTAKKVMKKLQPNINDFEPYVQFENFGDSSINFRASLMTENVEDKFVLIHTFIKELTKAYRRANIEIPYPQRDIHIKK